MRRDELDLEHALVLGDEALELVLDLVDLAQPALVGGQAQEVQEDRLGVPEDRVEPGPLRPRVDLRIEQEVAQLGRGLDRLDEAGRARSRTSRSRPFSFAASNSAFA